MAEAPKKAAKAAAPKKAAVSKANRPTDVIEVKNISSKLINTSVDSIQPGETGKATNGEVKRLHKFLEKI
ncbi:MAG: hypothetical protein DRQ47_04375 [Gammaproteobacteria bacterium]|nr:MAG: hypothetical protein DRQ47_04375 [Gammaproteobacteria bacterium]